jgi:FlgO protein
MRYLLVVTMLLMGLLAGCAHSSRVYPASSGSGCSVQDLLKATDLKMLFRDMARDICADKCPDCPRDTQDKNGAASFPNQEEPRPATVLVTDFVDINSFVPKQAGLLMGELMRGSLSTVCRYKIVQAEFAAYFKLSDNGLVSLTRKPSEIKNDEYLQDEAVVGTYNFLAGNKLLIFVKKINTGTSRISRMSTKELDYTCSDNSVVSYTVK